MEEEEYRRKEQEQQKQQEQQERERRPFQTPRTPITDRATTTTTTNRETTIASNKPGKIIKSPSFATRYGNRGGERDIQRRLADDEEFQRDNKQNNHYEMMDTMRTTETGGEKNLQEKTGLHTTTIEKK